MSVQLRLHNTIIHKELEPISLVEIATKRQEHERRMDEVLMTAREDVMRIFLSLEGKSIRTLKQRQKVCYEINECLQLTRLRIQCPECGLESLLRCYRNRTKTPFQYGHTYPTSIRHGWEEDFPTNIVLIEAARPRNRKARP